MYGAHVGAGRRVVVLRVRSPPPLDDLHVASFSASNFAALATVCCQSARRRTLGIQLETCTDICD
jgi:hypothetical protein